MDRGRWRSEELAGRYRRRWSNNFWLRLLLSFTAAANENYDEAYAKGYSKAESQAKSQIALNLYTFSFDYGILLIT